MSVNEIIFIRIKYRERNIRKPGLSGTGRRKVGVQRIAVTKTRA